MSQARPQTFLVGYREEDPRAHRMLGDHESLSDRRARTHGHMTLAARCGSCRSNVWLNPSGVEAMRERDCVVYCATCMESDRGYDYAIADLAHP